MKSAGLKTKHLRIPAGLLVTHHRISSSNPSTEPPPRAARTIPTCWRAVLNKSSGDPSFAEFEREMIRERTRAGLHEARAQGRVPGRKPKISAEQKKEIVEAVSSGRKTPAEIARLLKIHRATVSRIVSQARGV